MSKTTAYLVLLALAATFAGVSTTLLLQASAPPGEQQVAPSEAAVGMLDTLLTLAQSSREAELELLAASPELVRMVDPSQAPSRSFPVLRPDRPPERDSLAVSNAPEQLAKTSAALLDTRRALHGYATLALVNTRSRTVMAASSGELALQLLTLHKSHDKRRSGALLHTKQLYLLSLVPLPRHPDYALLAAELVDDAVLAKWREALANSAELSIIAKGEILISTAQDPIRSSIVQAAAELRSREAILASPTAITQAQNKDQHSIAHAVLALDAAGETSSLALLGSAALPTSAVVGVHALKAAPGLRDPAQNLSLWLTAVVALALLIVVGLALIRLDTATRLERLRAALDDHDQNGELSPAERDFVEFAQEKSSATQAPRSSDSNDNASLARLQADLEAAEATQTQLQKQLDFARTEYKRIKAELEQGQSTLKQTEEKLDHVQSQQRELAQQHAALESKFSQTQQKPARAAAVAVDETSSAPASAASPRHAAPVKEYPSIEVREFDTAEVSGEEMSQLLEEIDRGEVAASANDEEESLTALAERIGRLSESQLSKLEAAKGGEKTQPKGMLPTADGDGWDPDALSLDDLKLDSSAKKTSELWRVPSSSTENPSLASEDAGRTLTGGFRNRDLEANEAVSPPWKKESEPAQSLSPSTLLEALKRRGQNPDQLDEATDATKVSSLSRTFSESKPPEKPRTVSQSGVFTRTGSRVDIEPANDAEYFKSLFDEFLETKRRCGENTEKITLDRFIQRLAKNKQALVERYDCRTVRFQVYVKDGRAALKATPVK